MNDILISLGVLSGTAGSAAALILNYDMTESRITRALMGALFALKAVTL